MKKSKWNDSQIEELLKDLPQLKDHRSLHDIYQNISSKQNKRRKNKAIIPIVASIAAVFIFAFMMPYLLNELKVQQSADEAKISSSVKNEQNRAMMEMAEPEEKIGIDKDDTKMFTTKEALSLNVVYEQQLTNNYLVTVGFPLNDAENVVPLSTLVPKNRANSQIEAFQDVIQTFPNDEFGFGGEHKLKNAVFTEQASENYNNGKVLIKVNENTFKIGAGSAAEVEFILILQETFRWMGYQQVGIMKENGDVFEMSHYGPFTKEKLISEAKKGYFIFNNNDRNLLVPYYKSYESFNEALVNMKENQSTILQPSIPIEVNIEKITENGSHVNIIFSSNSKLTNTESDLLMIRAIMLTAREFGYESVTFKNLQVKNIGEIKMDIAHEVPIAPNLIQGQ